MKKGHLTRGNRKEDYEKARDVALDAAKSRAWLYPIKVCMPLPALGIPYPSGC